MMRYMKVDLACMSHVVKCVLPLLFESEMPWRFENLVFENILRSHKSRQI